MYSNSNNPVTYFHWKILTLAGIWTRDFPGTKPICYQLSCPGLDLFNISKMLNKSIIQNVLESVLLSILLYSHVFNWFVFIQNIILDSHEWIGQCTTGKHQSPIQILTNETVPANMKPFIFEFYGNPPVAESLTNNGHSVTFTLKAVREIAFPKVIPKLLLEVVWVWAQALLIFKKRLW